MLEWYVGIAATLLVLLIYFAYFFKFNWIKDIRNESRTRINGVYARSRNRKMGKLPPVYPNGWFALLESSQIKKGQVKHVSALGENFAIFRTERGVVNILDAYCPHLGANMGEGGRVKGDCLECPFHSWTFRGEDGRCDNIPYTEKVPVIAHAKAWKCCEVNHIVFVWYHAESAEPDWQPQPHTHISSGTWRYQGRNEFFISCHIQVCRALDSLMRYKTAPSLLHTWMRKILSAVHGPVMFLSDSVPWLAQHSWTINVPWRPHCSYSETDVDKEMDAVAKKAEVRVKVNGELTDYPIAGNGDEKNRHHFAVAGNEGIDRKEKHKAGLQMRHSLILLERFTVLVIDVRVEQIGPGYVELSIDTSFGPICILQTVTPIEPMLQRVTHQIFSPPLLAPYANLIFLGECVMFERDAVIWNHKRFERQPMLVSEERAIREYRRWYSQFYSDHSPTYQTAVDNLQW